jgi:hypothetical protein
VHGKQALGRYCAVACNPSAREDYTLEWMRMAALLLSAFMLLVLVIGTFRSVLQKRFPFVRKFDEETHHAYLSIGVISLALAIWYLFPSLKVESVEVAGVKATVQTLQTRVDTLSDQMEAFFKRKKIEIFDMKARDRVRVIAKTTHGFIVEVTLQQDPIPGSVEVDEGVLQMPEAQYHVNGKFLQFPSNVPGPDKNIKYTVKYYPRVMPKESEASQSGSQ